MSVVVPVSLVVCAGLCQLGVPEVTLVCVDCFAKAYNTPVSLSVGGLGQVEHLAMDSRLCAR